MPWPWFTQSPSRRSVGDSSSRAPIVLAAAAASAQQGGNDFQFKRSSLVVVSGGREIKFDVDLALDDVQRARGLMFREKLGPYEGMLFDFYKEAPVSFWMKNTLIPLDMVFIAADGTIKSIHANAVPHSTETIPSQFPVRAVLEINGGSAKLLGIKPGDKVLHPIFGLILVTAINPTPAGEGKTTTTVGLGDGLNRIGKKAVICLREPSARPCFGVKGGAAGGGMPRSCPMEEINLHFTGDFHAITSAHNLLSAMIDNHIYWGNDLGIDARRVAWRRVLDMNDRALRDIVVSARAASRTASRARPASTSRRLGSDGDPLPCERPRGPGEAPGDIVVAYTRDKKPVTAGDIKAAGAMAVLLKDAVQPNLVQTLENNPAFVHGGPFANIAHGCNSVIATQGALKLGDYVVTEAGFGADLGAEKFFDIKCRKAGLKPDAAVVVATVRALKMHGGVAKEDLARRTSRLSRRACANLGRHIENVPQVLRRAGGRRDQPLLPTPMPKSQPRSRRYVAVARAPRPILCSTGPRVGRDRGPGAASRARSRIRQGELRSALSRRQCRSFEKIAHHRQARSTRI
jgi:uncharacterized membrane protein (UPF0127 family)